MSGQDGRLRLQAYEDIYFTKTMGSEILADFNPTDFTLGRSNNYSAKLSAGTSKPILSYASGNNDDLEVPLLFDGTGVNGEHGSVKPRVDAVLALLEYHGDEHEPPYVMLSWGDLKFHGVLKAARTHYQLFDSEGAPLRAKVTATFEEVVSNRDRIAEESSRSPDMDRVWVVRSGDRIDRIAAESYGDVRYWRQLAKANGLVNPRSLEPGAVLSLPRLVRS